MTGAGLRLAPLPARPRPEAGETATSYIRRLAAANHLRPSYLHSILRDPFPVGTISPERLAALSGRSAPVLKRTLDGLGNRRPGPRSWTPRSSIFFLREPIAAIIAANPAITSMQVWTQLIDEHQADIGYLTVLRYRRERTFRGKPGKIN